MITKLKRLVESYTGKVRVDREAGIIYDVLMLGTESRNGITYPDSTRAAAVPLFEGLKANLSHGDDRTMKGLRRPRDFQVRIGKYKDVRNTPDGIRGNLKVLKSHPWANVLFDAAEEDADMFSLSPVMVGMVNETTNPNVCVKIKEARSVDIVTDGGTTKSLFEEMEEAEGEAEPAEEREATAAEHYAEACRKAVLEIVDSALDGEVTPEEAAKSIKEHLKTHLKMHGKEEEAEPGDTEEEAEIKEQLRVLKVEKECHLLIEEYDMTADSKELIPLLSELPTRDARVKHLRFLKNGKLVKKPKSATTNPNPTEPSVDESKLLETIRS